MIKACQARAIGRQMLQEHKKMLVRVYGAYFGITVGMSILLSVLQFVPGLMGLSYLAGLGIVFLTMPLALGMLHTNNMIYYKRAYSLQNLFDFFRNYHITIKVIGVSYIYMLMLTVALVPVMMIFMVPLVMGAAFVSMGAENILSVGMGVLFAGIVGVSIMIGMLFSSILMSCYFIALRNRCITFGKLFTSSAKIGLKYMWKYLVFQLSFFGWGLLCMIPLVVFGLLTIPFMAGTAFVSAGIGLWLVGTFLTLILCMILGAYINTSSVVFFNVAIDEYEQRHPDYSGDAPLHIPQAPAGGFEPPSSFENTLFQQALPQQEKTEHVQAEVIAPQQGVCSVVLLSPGLGRMQVAQILEDATGKAFGEVCALMDRAPVTVCTDLTHEQAHAIAARLMDVGAQVEIQP